MNTLSLCVICKNEEKNIVNLLESLKGPLFDEIVITDTGSTDKTLEILQNYKSSNTFKSFKIEYFKWIDDFSAARNYCFSKATTSYIMWTDSDDIIKPEDYTKLVELKQRLHEADTWLLKYEYAHDEFGKSVCSFFRERILNRSLNVQWQDPIHEYLPLVGRIRKENIEIHHYKQHCSSERNIKILEKSVQKDPTNARITYYLGKEYLDNNQSDQGRDTLEKYIMMPDAWIENKYTAFLKLSEYYSRHGNYVKAKELSLAAINLEPLKANAYCYTGDLSFCEKNWAEAIHWYKIASNMPRPENALDLIEPKYYTWLPHLQLCVAYNNVGNLEAAAIHNELALTYLPQDSRMLSNQAIFKKVLGSKYVFDKFLVPDIYSIYNKLEIKSEDSDFVEVPNYDALKSISIGWCIPAILNAGTIRIRTLNICDQLSKLGYNSKICDYSGAKEFDIIVIGKSYSENELKLIKFWHSLNKIVIADLSEDIITFTNVSEILKECDAVICCSEELRLKVAKINKSAILIEDAVEYII